MNLSTNQMYLLSKLRLIVALDSPRSFLAVTLYFPASSTVTFLRKSWQSIVYSFSSFVTTFRIKIFMWICNTMSEYFQIIYSEIVIWIFAFCRTWNFPPSATLTPSWNQVICGLGSATMAQWKIKVVPSGPCRIVGFVENVGAIPSTCGNDGASIAV